MKFAQRVETLLPEGAYYMLDKAHALESQGKKIIHLEIGQPDFPTFENISTAGVQAIQDGYTRYTPSAGIQALREAIAADAGGLRKMEISPSQVVVGPGAKPALFFPTLALVEPGDEIIYPDPGFPTYQAMIEIAGGVPVPVPLVENNNFSFDLDVFSRRINARTRMVILNSPGNPTGGVIPISDLEYIAEAAQKWNFWVLSDEIYSRLVYGDPVASIASLPGMQERTIICDGFSKTYAMTGWRLGYGIMPEQLAKKVGLLLTHSVGCTAGFVQVAGIEAIQGGQAQVERVVCEYQKRRDLVVDGLNKLPGITCQLPQGAFYAFPNISQTGVSSDWLAEYILNEAGVALLPGTSFGRLGEGYLRICFANSQENLNVALDRIEIALGKL